MDVKQTETSYPASESGSWYNHFGKLASSMKVDSMHAACDYQLTPLS